MKVNLDDDSQYMGFFKNKKTPKHKPDMDLYGITTGYEVCKKELHGLIWVLYGCG